MSNEDGTRGIDLHHGAVFGGCRGYSGDVGYDFSGGDCCRGGCDCGLAYR